MPIKTVAFYLFLIAILILAARHIADGIDHALIHAADRTASSLQ